MKKSTTIWAAAEQALISIGGSGTLEEIFSFIREHKLYEFGTADQSVAPHVLDTELKRKCRDSNRTDRTGSEIFEMIENGVYRLAQKEPEKMSEKKAVGTKRIHRSRDKEEIINSLMSDKVGVFREIWRLLLFAAQVGIKHDKREPLISVDSGKGIDQSTFGNCPSWPGVCYLIALVEENSSDALSGSADAEDLRLTIFQEYANGGLSVLQSYFQDRNVDLDAVLLFINNNSQKAGSEVDLDLAI